MTIVTKFSVSDIIINFCKCDENFVLKLKNLNKVLNNFLKMRNLINFKGQWRFFVELFPEFCPKNPENFLRK